MNDDLVIPEVRATDPAREAVRRLARTHGKVMFVQSGGCCDGSAPMCFADGEFLVGSGDVLVGDVEGSPVYVGRRELAAWEHRELVIDVEPGYADGLSLEAGDGLHFVSRTSGCLTDTGAPLPGGTGSTTTPHKEGTS
ncbi:MAG TPA: DUF779 domain-containing protein [Nocardioides sp.]|jgi:hypothetical protein